MAAAAVAADATVADAGQPGNGKTEDQLNEACPKFHCSPVLHGGEVGVELRGNFGQLVESIKSIS